VSGVAGLRILHIGKYYPPEYRGGIETFLDTLNPRLASAGADVMCAVAAYRGPPSDGECRGIRVQRVRSYGRLFSQPLAFGLIGLVRRTPSDIVHLHHPNPLGDVAVLAAGDRSLVVSHHSDVVRQRALWPVYGPLVRRVLDRAEAIVVASEPFRRSSRELRGFEGKIRVIPYGIEPASFERTPAVVERATVLRASWNAEAVILGVGRMVGYKGFDVLIQAARGLRARLVLVGEGPEAPRLHAMAGPDVVFAGSLSQPDLVAHYHAADVFCLPSVSVAEAFGIVLLEAMACGLPLVTTALPTGVSVVNRDGQTGWVVPPGDVGALRDALQGLLTDAQLRARLGATARQVFEAEYTATTMAERFLALYQDVARRG